MLGNPGETEGVVVRRQDTLRDGCSQRHPALTVGEDDEAVFRRGGRHRERTEPGVVAPLPDIRATLRVLDASAESPLQSKRLIYLDRIGERLRQKRLFGHQGRHEA